MIISLITYNTITKTYHNHVFTSLCKEGYTSFSTNSFHKAIGVQTDRLGGRQLVLPKFLKMLSTYSSVLLKHSSVNGVFVEPK